MSGFFSLTFILILIIHLIYFILHLLLRLVLYLLLCLVLYLILSFQVCRVFLGSFWEAPLRLEDNRWGKDVKREREREWRTEIVCICSRERVCARQSLCVRGRGRLCFREREWQRGRLSSCHPPSISFSALIPVFCLTLFLLFLQTIIRKRETGSPHRDDGTTSECSSAEDKWVS